MAAQATPWENAKEIGNQFYKNGKFEEAIAAWSSALSMLSDIELKDHPPSIPDEQDRDQQAKDLAKAALRGSSVEVSRLLSSGTSSAELNPSKSIVLANMAQAKIQMKDSAGAIRDCNQALLYDPKNMKALVRRGLAYEELGKLKQSLSDMDRAMKLPLSSSLVKVVGQARSRIVANMKMDRDLLNTCKDQNTLVNKDQTLRLHLHNSPPHVVQSGTPFRVDCNVANEFGLWRPKDFDSMCPTTREYPLCVKLRVYRTCKDAKPVLTLQQLPSDASSSSNNSFSSIALTSHEEANTSPVLLKQSREAFAESKKQVEESYENVLWMDESAQASMELRIEFEAVVSVFIEISPLPLQLSTPFRPVMPVLSLPIVIESDAWRNGNAMTQQLISNESWERWNKIGAHCCRVTSVELNIKEKLDIVVAESPGHLGIGGKVWDAALVLLHYLTKERHLIEGKSVVELGAGTGLVGIACHKLGAGKMFITDLSDVCELISVNIELNQTSTDTSLIQAVPIGWSDPAPPIPVQLLSTSSLSGDTMEQSRIAIDTILLSDVVYDPDLYIPLVSTLSSLVPPAKIGTPSIQVVLAHRHRNPMDPQFWAALACAGFTVEKVDLKAMGLNDVVLGGGAAADVNVFRVTRAHDGGNRKDITEAVANAIPLSPRT